MRFSVVGFNGERSDAISNNTPLGNGYRAFNPVLGRFTCPDSLSPFGMGGINPYVFCSGDPVNRTDPSGHFSVGQWIGMALGLVAGIALSMVTDGAATPAVLSLMSVVGGDTAIGAGAELAAEAIDGVRINWRLVGEAAGLSAVTTVAGFGTGKLIRLKGASTRPFGGLMMDGEAATRGVKRMKTGSSYGEAVHGTFAVKSPESSSSPFSRHFFSREQRLYMKENLVTVNHIQGPIFRGDTRTPDVIFKEGFLARGDDLDISSHIVGNVNSRFISFSKNESVAAFFSNYRASGNVAYFYEVDRLEHAIDISASSVNCQDIDEVIAIDNVPRSRIEGAYKIRVRTVDWSLPGTWIKPEDFMEYMPNPYFKG